MRPSSSLRLLILAISGLLLAQSASATSFVLSESANSFAPAGPLTVLGTTRTASVGETFTIVLGLDDVDELFSYTIDIQIDPSELAFVGSTQLACGETSPGQCEAPAFLIDPGSGLGIGANGRASVISADTLFADGRRNVPTGTAGPPGLFALTFEVLAGLSSDGLSDLTIGFLDEAADGITGSDLFGDPFAVNPVPDSISLSIVPEPSTFSLTTLGLAGLALGGRLRRLHALARTEPAD